MGQRVKLYVATKGNGMVVYLTPEDNPDQHLIELDCYASANSILRAEVRALLAARRAEAIVINESAFEEALARLRWLDQQKEAIR